MNARVDDLVYRIEARADQFERGMARVNAGFRRAERQAEASFRDVGRASDRAARDMERNFSQATQRIVAQANMARGRIAGALNFAGAGPLGAVVGAAGVGAAVAAVQQTAAGIAELRAQARRAGVEFEAFQRLELVSREQLVSLDALTDGFKELSLRADEWITTGGGPAAEAFRRLGFSATDLATRLEDPQELLLEILQRAEQLGTAGQIRVFDEIFGGTAGEQFTQLVGEVDEIRRSLQDAAVYTDETADKAERLDRAFRTASDAIEKGIKAGLIDVADYLSTNVLPIAQDVLDTLLEWGRALVDFASVDLSRLPEGTRIISDAEREAAALNQRFEELKAEIDEATRGVSAVETELEAARRVGDQLRVQRFTEDLKDAQAEVVRLRGELEAVQTLMTTFGPPIPPGFIPPSERPATAAPLPGAQGLNPRFESSLGGLLQAAQDAGHDVSITSGFRSEQRQRELWEAAVRRYGSEAEARRWVAPPGRSNHQFGIAADLRYGSDAARDFIHQNAANYGLHFPLGNEPWHVEPMGPGGNRIVGANGIPMPADRRDLVRRQAQDAARSGGAAAGDRRAATPAEDTEARNAQAEAIERVNEALQRELELLGLEGEQLSAGVVTRQELTAAQDAEALVREKIRDLKEAGVEVSAAMEEAIRAEVAALYELQAAQDQTASSTDRLAERTSALEGAFQSVGQPILDTFMSIIDGSEDASEALKRLALQLANMVLQAALFGGGPLGNLLGGGLFGGIFGGARAAGGPVTGGTPYLVGERGPELFVPGATGQIVNAAATRSLMARAATPVSAAGMGRGEAVRVELVSRFDADGGFSSAVERASRPVAIREARTAASEVAARVPEMTDARMDQRDTRRTRPLRPALNVSG